VHHHPKRRPVEDALSSPPLYIIDIREASTERDAARRSAKSVRQPVRSRTTHAVRAGAAGYQSVSRGTILNQLRRTQARKQGIAAMTDLPSHVEIHEEGPREGFQIEPGPIPSADKIRLIEALAETGLHHIQACSFVNTRLVPGWADAEAVVAGFTAKPGVEYTGLFFNGNGLDRALAFNGKLTVHGSISLTASEGFTRKNLNRSHAENVEAMKKHSALQLSKGIPVNRIGVMAAFGCNYQGDISPAQVIRTLHDGLAIARETGAEITLFSLADTMGWATPARIERVIGEVRSHWPDVTLSLHLHDTRGLAIANAHAGLKLGVTRYDSTVGGLGGCPFAGQPKAAGNICTEELVLLCEEMGIDTGVDLDALIEAGRLAEKIVGHQLPSELIHAGSLDAFRRKAA
jgi:isopropylmalate/homocitrate/citramalate synthase